MSEEPEVELGTSEQMSEGTNLDDLAIDSAALEAATGIHVITISYDDSDPNPPKLNLGGTSAWVAFSILHAAIESLEMLRPPLTVIQDGRTVLSSEYPQYDDDEDDDEEM
jgi:hypothetical protein